MDIPEDIFGHQICLRKECWKLQRKKKKKSKQICKNWIFCKQTADIGCWKMFVYNYYYNKMFCFVHWALSSSQIIRKLKKILSLFWNMLEENEKKNTMKKKYRWSDYYYTILMKNFCILSEIHKIIASLKKICMIFFLYI